MAEKLSIQIALDGGAEIQRQLADIGEAGKKAFGDIAKSAEQVGGFKNIKPEEVTAKLQELGITGVESINKIQQAVKSAGRLESLVQGIATAQSALKALAIAAPVVGAAIAAGMYAAAKATISFAESISKAGDEARKIGLGIEQFDRVRLALEGAGTSAKDVAGIMQRLGQAAEKADLSRVAQAAKELQDAMSRGFGAQGTEQLKILEEAARKAGAAGKAARAEMVKLGLPIPTDAALTLEEFIAKTGNAESGLRAFIAQLRQMPAGAERDKLAMDQLNVGADKLIAAYDKLAAKQLGTPITADMLAKADELTASVERLRSAYERFGSVAVAPAVVGAIDLITQSIEGLDKALQRLDWSTLGTGARFALSPIATIFQLIQSALGGVEQQANTTGQALQQTGQAGAQAGQQAAQGLELVRNPLTGMAELARTTNQAFQQTGQAAAQAGQQGAQGFQPWDEALGRVTQQAQQAQAALQQAGQAGTQAEAGVSAWDSLGAAIQRVIDKVLEFFAAQSKAGAAGGGGAPGPAQGFARGGLLGGRGSGISDSNLAWVSRGEHIMPARVVRQPGVLALLEALRRSGRIPGFAEGGAVGDVSSFKLAPVFNSVIDSLKSAAEGLQNAMNTNVDSMRNLEQTFVNGMEDTVNQLQQNLQTVLDSILSAATALQQLNPSSKARGGLLGGRGSGTSDSNLAWLSRGEYVTPAHAVRQPGVLAFLEALRRSGGNLRAVLDGMGRFALGGMVPRPIPAFTAGGLAGGMSNVTIQFPGLPAIGGLRASSEVVDELRKAAALAQVRSGGRKPSRYS